MLSVANSKAPEASQRVRAKLDAAVWTGLKKPVAPGLAFVARRPADKDLATPAPLGATRRVAGPSFVPAKRP
jgi:hypothetical protein